MAITRATLKFLARTQDDDRQFLHRAMQELAHDVPPIPMEDCLLLCEQALGRRVQTFSSDQETDASDQDV